MLLDIHTHILPNIDDGSKSLDDTLIMLNKEIECGVTDIICTPHHKIGNYTKTKDDLLKSYNLVNKLIKDNNLNINIYLGNEIYVSSLEDTIKMLKDGKLYTLNNSNVVLLEFSYHHMPRDIEEIFYNFKVDGYKVVLAHVERYTWITLDLINRFKANGVYIQVNADAILGKMGLRSKLFVKKLIKNNLIDYIATDMHIFRQPNLSFAMSKIKDTSKLNRDIFNISNNK